MTALSGSWEAREWAHSPNYFAATLADTFLSRRAYLHAPAAATSHSIAAASMLIAAPDDYHVLVRYEALYRFETSFRVTIEQAGQVVLEAVYGRRSNLKVWPFGGGRMGCGDGLVAECVWPYGASESILWEGVGKTAFLQKGMASVTLTAVDDCTAVEGCLYADRNIDVIMLHPNASDIRMRMAKETVILPFDGLLSQQNEVFIKITNHDAVNNITVVVPISYGHSPFMAGSPHLNLNRTFYHGPVTQPPSLAGNGVWIYVAPGGTSDWVDIGCMFDTLNHGTLNMPVAPADIHKPYFNKTSGLGGYSFVIGVNSDPFGKAAGPQHINPIHTVPFDSRLNDTQVYIDASTRASQRVQHQMSDFISILQSLDEQGAVPGKPLEVTPLFALGFKFPESPGGGCFVDPAVRCALGDDDPQFAGIPKANLKFRSYYGSDEGALISDPKRSCFKCNSPGGRGKGVEVITLGDEIGLLQWAILGQPPFPQANTTGFQRFLQHNKIFPASIGCTNRSSCNLTNIGPPSSNKPLSLAAALYPCGLPLENGCALTTEQAMAFYISSIYVHNVGIANFQNQTRFHRNNTSNRTVGINFTPAKNAWHVNTYIGTTLNTVRGFREGALMLPWSEDWIFQSPVASQQVMSLILDAMRSGIQWAPDFYNASYECQSDCNEISTVDVTVAPRVGPAVASGGYRRVPTPKRHLDMQMYIMKHWPGNTGKSWKRQLFSDVNHGVTFIDLFFFETSWQGYTCDYVDADGGAYIAVREGINLLGSFEDIVQNGVVQAQGAAVALLYSETADIFADPIGTFGTGLRTLYLALRHAELPIDIVTETDAALLKHYACLFVTQPHVTTSFAAEVASWVAIGGQVSATAGAGLLNESNQTNLPFAALLGINQSGIHRGWRHGVIMGSQDNRTIVFTKQDLRFAELLDTVTLDPKFTAGDETTTTPVVAKGVKSIFTSTGAHGDDFDVTARFADGSTAAQTRAVGQGRAHYCGFLPGLSYYEPAIPLRPVDRSSVDSGFNHFIPTEMDASVRNFIAAPLCGVRGAAPVTSSNPLVEVGVITALELGTALPIVNWAGAPQADFVVTLHFVVDFKAAALASGRHVTVSGANRSVFTFAMSDTIDAIILR